MNKTRMIGIAAALASTCFATPALAATSTRVVITQDQQDVPETRIQLFDIDTGAEVKREEDEDETGALFLLDGGRYRSEEHTSELQSLMRISYAVFCLQKKKTSHKKKA